MNFVVYAIPFFVIAMLIEYFYGRARQRNTYQLADTINSLQMGTLSRLRGVLQIGIGGAVYGAITNQFTLLSLPDDEPLVWIAAFVGYDICYYFFHRYSHEWRLFWAAHVAHHQSEEYNLSTALRQTSTGYLGFVFYIPLYVLGFSPYLLISVGSLNLIYQFWVHTEHIRRLGVMEMIFVTPSNHRVHHAKNPEYLDRNYGGVFILWDRIFGTYMDEDDARPCVYGTTKPLASWNPLWANTQVWYEGFTDMVRTKHFSDKFRLWVKAPGWRPRDLRDTQSPSWQAPKFEPQVSAFARIYTFLQFWAILLGSFAVLYGNLSRTMTLASAVLMAFSFYVQGTWLEGRTYALTLETIRLALSLALIWIGALIVPQAWSEFFAMLITGYLAASTLALVRAKGPFFAQSSRGDSLDVAPGKKPAH